MRQRCRPQTAAACRGTDQAPSKRPRKLLLSSTATHPLTRGSHKCAEPLVRTAPTLLWQAFIEYYTAQGTVPAAEWPAFEDVLREPLPVVLRVSKTYPCYGELLSKLEANPELHCLDWSLTSASHTLPPQGWCRYPDGLAWQCSSEYYSTDDEFREWARQQNYRGALAFQEAVSLLPPLCLQASHPTSPRRPERGVQLEPHHLVLDMCAAPGSKTLEVTLTLTDVALTGRPVVQKANYYY